MPVIRSLASIVFGFGVRSALCSCALVAAAALASTSVRAQAQQSPSPPQARVIVTGEGSAQVSPDYAQIRGGATTRGKTVGEAVDANSKAMAAVTAALRDAGIAQEDIRTAQFTIHPLYQPQQAGSEPKLTGYDVTNQVTVTVRAVDKVPDVLDRMVAAGANEVSAAEFLVSDLSKALDRAREAAVADARRKAELYARAAGFTLGRVAGLSEENGPPPFPASPLYRAAAAAPSVPISAGDDTVRVRVTVGYDIANW